MEEQVFERRLQQSHGTFLLTIPGAMVKRAKLHRGQGVRLTFRNGEIIITPTGAVAGGGGGAADPEGLDPYKRAITDMMAKGSKSERPAGPRASSGKSKLERLRLK